MTRIKKALLPYLGMALFAAFLFSVPARVAVHAEQTLLQTDTTFTLGSAQARAGEQVQIPVTIRDCVPFFAMGLKVDYNDRVLELTGIRLHQDSRLEGTASLDLPPDLSKGRLNFVNNSGGNIRVQDGPFLDLRFQILPHAQSGESTVHLSISSAGWVSWEEEMLQGTFIPGTVQVQDSVVSQLFPVHFTGGPNTSGSGRSMEDKAPGSRFPLPSNTFHKEGFLFTGWHDGQDLYLPSTYYLMPGHEVTFVAQWQAMPPATGLGPGAGSTETTPEPRPSEGVDPYPSSEAASSEGETGRPGEDPPSIHLEIQPEDRADREIKLTETEEGLHLQGKDLKDLSLDIIQAGNRKRVKLNTDKKEVLIKGIDDGVIEILVDLDGDGDFETPLASYKLVKKPIFLQLAAGGLTLLVAVVLYVLGRRAGKKNHHVDP